MTTARDIIDKYKADRNKERFCITDNDYYYYLSGLDYIYEKVIYTHGWYTKYMRVVQLDNRYIAYFVGVYLCPEEREEDIDISNIYEVFPKEVKTVVYE